MTFFDRRASLVVGNIRIEGLRFSFSVEKKDGSSLNTGSIEINNLSSETRAQITKEQRVSLEAGYASASSLLFTGTSYRVNHSISGPDTITKIEAADGGKEVRSSARAWSFGANASVAAIVREMCLELGIPLSTASIIQPTPARFRNGWTFVGQTARGLDKITNGCGLRWSVQDGQIVVLPVDAQTDGSQEVLISKDSGMIGSPERGEKGRVKIKTLINPLIRPDRIVRVQSIDQPGLSGRYSVRGMKATGDTHGTDWTMEIDALQVR